MIDQIFICGKGSFDDFGASVAARKDIPPKKKEIKEKVPFSNITYDFTKINGEIYWEERELEYALEMTAPTAELLEEMKRALKYWLMNIIEEDLHDPIDTEYHYRVTYSDMSFDDDESLEKTTATVKFTAYPFKISNYAKEFTISVGSGETKILQILNNSHHKIIPTITTSGSIYISYNGFTGSIYGGTFTSEALMLSEGLNKISFLKYIDTNAEPANVSVRFFEEVF